MYLLQLSDKYNDLSPSFFLLTRYQCKIFGIGVTPLTSSTVHWHTQSQRRHSSKFTKAFNVGLHLCLLSLSGLTPWRVPAGDLARSCRPMIYFTPPALCTQDGTGFRSLGFPRERNHNHCRTFLLCALCSLLCQSLSNKGLR